MRKLRKLIGILLTMALILGMSVTAFADTSNTVSITIKNAQKGHTYEVYQVFEGDLSTDETTLSNITWGDGVSTAGQNHFGTAAAKAKTLTTAAVASSFAKEIVDGKYLGRTAATVTMTADGSHTFTNLTTGYYLIKDADKDIPAGDAYTQYIFKVTNDEEVTIKSDRTTVTKQVVDVNDSTGVTATGNSADYDIGDEVPFVLTATLANNVASYNTYKVVFHDTLSKGLTYTEGSIAVKLGGKDVTDKFTVGNDGTALTISCDNVKAFGATNGSVITVTYTAKLNNDAVIGTAGNENKVKLEYSNNPNADGTGTTPEDTAIVFTYKIIANKVTEDNEPLEGAGFTLYKKNADGNYTAIGTEVKGTDMTTFQWSGVDDGTYKLVETTTPDGHNTMEDIIFTIDATHTIDGITELSGGERFTADKAAGSLTTDIVNTKGTVLPSTGGMGTTILYLIGGLLVVAAGAVLIYRRRTESDE